LGNLVRDPLTHMVEYARNELKIEGSAGPYTGIVNPTLNPKCPRFVHLDLVAICHRGYPGEPLRELRGMRDKIMEMV
jgi:hypothetical protein